MINEVAYGGSGESTCNGEDWIELLNTDDAIVVNLTNYVLHDDKGKDDESAKTFSNGTMAPGAFLVLCRDEDFAFGIGSDDTVTLLGATGMRVNSVALTGAGNDEETYSYFDGDYKYTTTPTPGKANVYTKPMTLEEKLRVQNDAGADFFLENNEQQTFSKVVDIRVSMDEESMSSIDDHPAWEVWVPFNELYISNTGGNSSIDDDGSSVVSSGKGKIRVRGQSTNTVTVCIGFKNVPFGIQFNTPFLGMETMYLRNHLSDASFMREHASHSILKAVDLPYLRTRPARLFLNGNYTGFYTLMEAPTQGYVMQRSFGAFEPAKTALFKAKTSIADCPYTNVEVDGPAPNPYYFERGDHREDTPVLGVERTGECVDFFFKQVEKEQSDVARGYVEYEKKCGLAMVELGRVDRDYGPKSMEDPMIDFLDQKFYNKSVEDLSGSIDTDQWLRNFAIYAITLNLDSPMVIINNWYLTTTGGGVDDWKIVQYDHNNIATKLLAGFCNEACGPRMVYWPILQPTCASIDDNMVVGRVLHSKENMQKYLDYIREYVDILATSNVLEKLYEYGNDIKEYVKEDPWFVYPTLESYEEWELGTNIQDYNLDTSPFLKVIQVRLEEVQKQLDAIQEGTLPRNGVYDPAAFCPDWRDSDSGVIVTGSTVADDCVTPGCAETAPCYSNNLFSCSSEGEIINEECKAATLGCDSCFPYSRCGTGTNITVEQSGIFVESETCGLDLAECAPFSTCFDHTNGICAFDGIILTVECQASLPSCKPCFPYSRCGSGEKIAETSIIDEVKVKPVEKVKPAEKEEDETTDDDTSAGIRSRYRSSTVFVAWIVVLVILGL